MFRLTDEKNLKVLQQLYLQSNGNHPSDCINSYSFFTDGALI